jgi:hypothetical protein
MMIQEPTTSDGPVGRTLPMYEVDLDSVARTGVKAVVSLWHDDTFLRSSTDETQTLRPTVTFRCTEVLLAARATAPDMFDRHAESVLEAAAAVILGVDPDDVLERSDLHYKAYTAALLVLATSRIASCDLTCSPRGRDHVACLFERLASELPRRLDEIHPFVQEHALRALRSAEPFLPAGPAAKARKLRRRLEASTQRHAEQLLAKHHVGLITPGESVALAFCGAALTKMAGARTDRIALAALEAAIAAQDAAGSWPLGRVVRAESSRLDKDSRLEVSTHEVAWVVASGLAELLGRMPSESETAAADIAGSIERAARFTDRSLVDLGNRQGWASDHPYQKPHIESWTSAIALQFALAADELRREVRTRDTLRTFTSISPSDDRWPAWLNWTSLSKTSEPDSRFPVYEYLQGSIIEPILAHPRQLPSKQDNSVSVLLFGPPGTSKTTLVQAVAHSLKWPVVFLSPGTFIEHGMEAIEASAQSVFGRLQSLRRVVVIFDECDELFRDRSRSESNDGPRNISAFVTASMLPKLQDLHDRGEVLFFICTNHVRMMDSAVLRGGRIDHRIGVGPPDEAARATILRSVTRAKAPRHLDSALEELARLAERFSRSELERAASQLVGCGGWSDQRAARVAATKLVEELQPTLTIKPQMMADFEDDRDEFGHIPRRNK